MSLSTSAQQDIGFESHAGATIEREYQWLSDDGVTPVDLTGATGACKFKSNLASPAVLTAVVTITDAVNGKFEIRCEAVDTAAIVVVPSSSDVWMWLYFDVLITLGADTFPVVWGKTKMYPSPTAQ